jgi:hypothetical protein
MTRHCSVPSTRMSTDLFQEHRRQDALASIDGCDWPSADSALTSLSSPQCALNELINVPFLSHALLTCWHQAFDLHQKVTTDNANAILVG